MLRSRLHGLHEKLFKNILEQKETIRLFFKRSKSDAIPKVVVNSSDNDFCYVEKNERLLCFTLATLAYVEKMIQKLTQLMQLYPTADSKLLIFL
jgi:hypothetical protein